MVLVLGPISNYILQDIWYDGVKLKSIVMAFLALEYLFFVKNGLNLFICLLKYFR